MRSRSKKRIKIIPFFIIVVLMLIFYTKLFKQEDTYTNNGKKDADEVVKYYPVIEDTTAEVNKYYIYGMSFNVEGVLKLNDSTIKDIVLVLKTENEKISLKTNYEIKEDIISFQSSNIINDGIVLDNLKTGSYFLLLEVVFNNDELKYYSLMNATAYGDIEYYSMTRNNQNKRINVNFISKDNKAYTKIEVDNVVLPEDVYDIVIDPGHGGIDPGAVYKGREEAILSLDVSKKVKKELEKLGFKVKLTRDNDYNPGYLSGIEQYGPGGRVSIPYETKAKYIISIHVNSDNVYVKKGGLEIYMANNSKLDLARLFVNNILANTAIDTSPNPTFRKEKGIYVRTFSNADIKIMKKDTDKNNYKMYDVTTQTPYYYMIRETGGMVTKAYNDGRNPEYNKNDYYNSNIGVESYIIELGYINCDSDYNIITRDQVGYARGIAKSFESYVFQE